MSNEPGLVRCLTRCTIKPYPNISKQTQPAHQQERKQQKPHHIQKQQSYHLTPWDLSLISAHSIQFGLLYAKLPSSLSVSSVDNVGDQYHSSPGAFVDQLKHSLSQTLPHFLPLSGRFVTNKHDDPPSSSISIECSDENNSFQGVEFIVAAAPITLNDILSPRLIPPTVRSFLTLHGDGAMLMVNHDGHTTPLLSVQVTELVDGYFIGCSINHAVVDGTSFWHFFNAWAEICREKKNADEFISRPPILDRWFLNDYQKQVDNVEQDNHAIINLPFSHSDEFISRYPPPPLVEKIFHISAQSMSQLQEQANNECGTVKISKFQALTALIWRSLTRARGLHPEQETSCGICINDRDRLHPPLSENYFGCYITVEMVKTKAGELLRQNLGSTALGLHEVIADHTDENIRSWLNDWKKEPKIINLGSNYDNSSMLVGGSPRFNPYGCDFGWGKPLAVLSGWPYKFSGNVWTNPGKAGGGSVDLEICLSPEAMSALESDDEFMGATSTHHEKIL
ncbi:protein ENHANCED PSEUDOMONAS SUSCEPTIBILTY 1-like [Papaver somniferum]|uniref:protein ENHANCED PSEUDOMONAS SUSCEPTIBILTY 1-like n=1 Tax=Papaver somniferum TaxID=3469 RepID=UPI000E6FEA61|nr:protein ENHANCED PSEUDOMONAS SUSCEPTIBILTY 1-like [Papaver somniferum]